MSLSLRRAAAVVLAVAVLASAPGCDLFRLKPAVAATVSPEGQTAIYGRQAITIADGALTALDTATELRLGLLTNRDQIETAKAQTRQAAGIIGKIGKAGEDLGIALKDFHDARLAAKGEAAAADKVRAVLARLMALSPEAIAQIDDPKIRAAVTLALAQVGPLILNVAALLPPVAAPAG